ncbi:cleavage induced hypothetical protein [Phytophthora infestans T30-4]|uniref:DDE-1 domain-containing protein n=1 Tax=Phytophthora infestans (strain T30-4) TaxID=403677 RepID=D0NF34_PHYIT|nr:cleavage induced hypothetical protein [Phytophthora infestans T30-4]EEY56823.1 cleavage induced hypothetical protein [Phytophthora infestans T30-4]|eukprot:XP_002902151.1 cleavage induced hypothetical protein [Phytophthora infestans T30-4]
MKRFLLQDASNAGWVKAQEARTQINTASAQIRLQAYPELSTKSRSNISRIRSKALHYNTLTWKERSVVIFYYLHPLLGNKDAEVKCRVFGVRHATFTNWVTKHSYYPKWVPFVEFMTVRTALNSIPVEFRAIFDESQLDVESGVSIPVQFRTPTTKRYVTATSHPQLSRQKVVKIAKKSEGVKYLTTSVRTVIKKGWESGNPMSRNEIYLRLIQQSGNDGILGPPSEFCSVMKLNGGGISPALAQWVRRRLEGANWSIRKESVYTEFVIPTGTKRVGSNVASDAKKGCTVMVSAEMSSSKVLPPFYCDDRDSQWHPLLDVFTTWRDEGGDASVHIQPSHWMDTPTAKKYADLFAHICQEMIDYLNEKGIMYEFIPAGLTSIMQICDLYVNRPLKAAIKKNFMRWKVSQTIPPGGKYKVDRVQVIQWVEEAVSMVNEKQNSDRKIEYMFKRLGQDPRQPSNQAFQEHIGLLQENEVYNSLLLNQTAENLV